MAPECDCYERHVAERDNWFIYDASVQGWKFTDAPLRTLTPAAAYFAIERSLDNHAGEPYAWISCPFCGGDLVSPEHDEKWSLGDGNGG